MKKFIVLLLTVAMTLTLTACAPIDYKKATQAFDDCDYATAYSMFSKLEDYKDSKDYAEEAYDKLLVEKVVGEWTSDEIDATAAFMSGFNEGMPDFGVDPTEYFNNITFKIRMDCSLKEDGTITLGPNSDSLHASIEGLKDVVCNDLILFLQDILTLQAEESGVTLQQVFEILGAENIEELIEMSLGMSIDKYFDEAIASSAMEFENLESEGKYSVRHGKIIITADDGTSDNGDYDLDADTITFSGRGASEVEKSMYPMVFKRK